MYRITIKIAAQATASNHVQDNPHDTHTHQNTTNAATAPITPAPITPLTTPVGLAPLSDSVDVVWVCVPCEVVLLVVVGGGVVVGRWVVVGGVVGGTIAVSVSVSVGVGVTMPSESVTPVSVGALGSVGEGEMVPSVAVAAAHCAALSREEGESGIISVSRVHVPFRTLTSYDRIRGILVQDPAGHGAGEASGGGLRERGCAAAGGVGTLME
jgi:hypothetical protein